VALVRIDIPEEHISSIIKVTRISELGTKLALTSNRSTMRTNGIYIYIFLRSVLRLLVNVNIIPSSLILVTPIMNSILSSEVSILTRVTRRYIPEEALLMTIIVKMALYTNLSRSSEWQRTASEVRTFPTLVTFDIWRKLYLSYEEIRNQ
jgi:hypothetical protein